MAAEKIQAETRTEFGKGAARRIRREDKVPAVVYGHGKDPMHVTLPGHDTMMALKRGGANALLELDIDGTAQLALTKQIQIDPIRRTLEHIDFVAIIKGEKVTVEVPVHLEGEAARGTLELTLPVGSTLLLDGETLIVNVTEQLSEAALEAELESAEAEAGIEREESDEDSAEESGDADSSDETASE